MATEIVNYVIYRDNPYHQLLFNDLQDRYVPVRGTIDLAIEKLEKSGSGLFHVHWEEHCLRACPTAAEARSAVRYFEDRARSYKKAGGRICWTIHNALPHELEHIDSFVDLRKMLADVADKIFVHNLASISLIREQVAIDPTRLFYLPHPSYLGIYEDSDTPWDGQPAEPRTLLAFGKVRRYKGLENLLDVLMPGDFMRLNGLTLKIAGQPLAGDTLAEEIGRRCADRDDITLDFRNIAAQDVPALLRSAGCIVMPYERFLTSGVSLLCLTLGVVVVAPDSPQIREVLPSSCHRLLFRAGDAEDLRRALLEAAGLSGEERRSIAAACRARAHYLRPARLSHQLGTVYDGLLEAR